MPVFGDIKATRVGYLDVPVPPELLGLVSEDTTAEHWSERGNVEQGQVVLSACAWFAETDKVRVVFDPFQTLDLLLRSDPESEQVHQAAIADSISAQDLGREHIDRVLMTHIEGVGMVAWRDGDQWLPFFPNATVMISEAMLASFEASDSSAELDDERLAWRALIAAGRVATFADGEEVAPGIIAEVTHAHGPGHSVFHLATPSQDGATFIGHLAVTPLHLATGPCEALNEDADAANKALHRFADDRRQLIGPVWPEPGHLRWDAGSLRPALTG